MAELKPCVCGGKPMYYIGAYCYRYIVKCPKCTSLVGSDVSFGEVVRKWNDMNRRAGDVNG